MHKNIIQINVANNYFVKLVSSKIIMAKPYHTQIKCQGFI